MTAHTEITGYLTPEDVARARALWNKGGKVQKIMAEVSAISGVSMDDLRGKSRIPMIADARRLVWFAAAQHGLSASEIAMGTGHSRKTVQGGIAYETRLRRARGQA